MKSKTQVLWGYVVVNSFFRGFAEFITSLFKFKPELASLITAALFIQYIMIQDKRA